MGARIEMADMTGQTVAGTVAPLVGARIEMGLLQSLFCVTIVAPLVGERIEITVHVKRLSN